MKSKLKIGIMALMVSVIAQTQAQEKKQHFVHVSRDIKAPADLIWQIVGEDFGAIAKSHPKIVSSNYINGSLKGGEGAERVCNFNEKGTKFTHEKQVEFDPENRTFVAQVLAAEGIPLVEDLSFATYKVEFIDTGTSRLIVDFKYRTKPAFLGGLAKGNFKKTLSDYLIAVEHHVLTKEDVTKDNFREIRKQYQSK